jgi:hypothetical protein
MNLHSVLGISAMMVLGLGLLSGSAADQQKSLKEQIIGTWLFVSVYDQYEDGKKAHTFGINPKGQWIFGNDGRFSEILVGEPQPDLKTKDPRRPDAFIVAWYGTYTVNEADKTVTWRAEGGGYSPRFGSESKLLITTITGDTLNYVGPQRKDHIGTFTPHAELKRAK